MYMVSGESGQCFKYTLFSLISYKVKKIKPFFELKQPLLTSTPKVLCIYKLSLCRSHVLSNPF